MRNWSLEFELIDRTDARLPIARTASFPSLKWNRKAVALDIPRLAYSASHEQRHPANGQGA